MREKEQRPSRRVFICRRHRRLRLLLDPEAGEGLLRRRSWAAMTVNEKVKPGVSKWDLDTPALCVDLDKMEKNVATMQAALKKYGLPSRPHAKTHKCAAIAKYQLATGSIGICCAKLSEAEALVAQGVDRILMTTSNPSMNKIRRAMRSAKIASATSSRRSTTSRTRATCLPPRRKPAWSRTSSSTWRSGREAVSQPGAGAVGVGPADRQAAESQAARHPLVRRWRAARERDLRTARSARSRRSAERRDVRA